MRRSEESDFQAEEPAGSLERKGAPPCVEQLRHLALACRASSGLEGATRVVPGEGNPTPEIVLVGEAPGEEEDRSGRPFVGRSGKLLDKLLVEAGLDRSELWITNAVKVRPVLFEEGRKRNRAPKASEIKAWSSCLRQELALLRPKILVGLGAIAGQALVGKGFRITQERGEWFRDPVLDTWTLVTWHPSYLLRQTGDSYDRLIAQSRADLRAVRERLRNWR